MDKINNTMLFEYSLRLSQDMLLNVVIIFSVVICCCGASLSSLLLLCVYRARQLHANLRLVLVGVCVSMQLMSVGQLCLALHNLVNALLYGDSCGLCTSHALCLFRRLMFVFPMFSMVMGTTGLMIERLVATLYHTSYEANNSIKLGATLVCLPWLLTTPLFVRMALTMQEMSAPMPFCVSVLLSPSSLKFGIVTFILLELVALSGLQSTLRWNAKKQQQIVNPNHGYKFSENRVSRRYQLRENLSLTRALLPALLCHLMITGVGMGVLPFYIIGRFDNLSHATVAQAAPWSEVTTCVLQLFTITFPLVCFYQITAFRKVLLGIFCKNSGKENSSHANSQIQPKLFTNGVIPIDSTFESYHIGLQNLFEGVGPGTSSP